MRQPWQVSSWLAASTLLVRLAGILLLWVNCTSAVKLRMQKSECVSQAIKGQSLVTVVVVASPYRGQDSFFDLQVGAQPLMCMSELP